MNWFALIAYVVLCLIVAVTFLLVWVTFAMVFELCVKVELIPLPEDEENLVESEEKEEQA